VSGQWVRMNDNPKGYISLQIGHDRIVERRVVDGVVVAERELDEIPEKWPEIGCDAKTAPAAPLQGRENKP